MLLIPYKTDAPIYHLPYATVGLMVANAIVLFVVGAVSGWSVDEFPEPELDVINGVYFVVYVDKDGDDAVALLDENDPRFEIRRDENGEAVGVSWSEEAKPQPKSGILAPSFWQLTYGDGLHPHEWITSNFGHSGLMHLIGNMVFLWVFGLVVEGKVGWMRFLAIYFGIGIGECAFEQTIMLGSAGGASCGASSIVFGLMVIALLWAPENHMSCFVWIVTMATFFDVKIVTLAMIYVALEVLWATLDGFAIGTSVLHLFGAAFGLAIGVLMLKLNLVDCEGWDYFSVRAGRHIKSSWEMREQEDDDTVHYEKGVSQKQTAIEQHVQRLLDEGNAEEAHRLYVNSSHGLGQWDLPEETLLGLITGLDREKRYDAVLPVMTNYVERYPQGSILVRLKLAQLLLEREKRPAKAMRVIEMIEPAQLNERMQQALARMRTKAEQLAADDDTELELADE